MVKCHLIIRMTKQHITHHDLSGCKRDLPQFKVNVHIEASWEEKGNILTKMISRINSDIEFIKLFFKIKKR